MSNDDILTTHDAEYRRLHDEIRGLERSRDTWRHGCLSILSALVIGGLGILVVKWIT